MIIAWTIVIAVKMQCYLYSECKLKVEPTTVVNGTECRDEKNKNLVSVSLPRKCF